MLCAGYSTKHHVNNYDVTNGRETLLKTSIKLHYQLPKQAEDDTYRQQRLMRTDATFSYGLSSFATLKYAFCDRLVVWIATLEYYTKLNYVNAKKSRKVEISLSRIVLSGFQHQRLKCVKNIDGILTAPSSSHVSSSQDIDTNWALHPSEATPNHRFDVNINVLVKYDININFTI